MTDLYKEALLEAKKLKEIAEEDAKKSLIEALSPYIKKVITKQINESAKEDILFKEQDEVQDTVDTAGLDLNSSAIGDTPTVPPITDPNSVNVQLPGPDSDGKLIIDVESLFLPDEQKDLAAMDATVAPLAAPVNANPETMAPAPAAPVPAEPVAPAPAEPAAPVPAEPVAPAPAAPEPNVPPTGVEQPNETPMTDLAPEPDLQEPVAPVMESYESWKKIFLETSEKIDKVYFSKKIPELVSESLKNKLFYLLENLDSLKEKGVIRSEQVKINENKLEFLFLKLKEANLNNSYIEKDQKEEKNMTSLKEYAAKLFAESFAEEGDRDNTNQKSTASAKHAASVSGVGPGVELNEEMLPVGDTKPGDCNPEEKHWKDGEPTLSEKDQDKVIEEALAALEEEVEAKGHAGFGDSDEEPCVEPMLEIDENELKEAIRQIKKESLKRKMAKLQEEKVKEGDQGSAKPLGGDNPAKKNLNKKPGKTNLKPVEALMAEETELEDMDMLDDEVLDVEEDLNGDADMVLNIDLPDEVEDALSDIDTSVLNDIDVSLGDINIGSNGEEELEDFDSEEDFEADEVEGDDEVSEVDVKVPGEEEDRELLVDDEAEEPEEDEALKALQESYKRSKTKGKLLETRLTETVKLASNLKKEVGNLKSELKEANLFIAKNVYFTKFLQRGDLTKANLSKIVEHLDRARTVQEAKEIYTKIKNKLAESVTASNKLIGSSSKVTKSGSAVSLNESVNHEDGFVIDPKRWQKLANIKVNDE